jgi:hypothetical protein
MNINEQVICNSFKRIRESKFTEKRNPYKKYQKAKWNWTDIFKEIDLLKNNTSKILKKTSIKYNINYKTLKNKYSKYSKENKFNINEENRGKVNKFNINEENRGKVNKFFTDNEEKEIFLFVKDNFINKHKVLCNDIIKIHAHEKFKKIYPNDIFKASDGWCNDFKKRWNLSTVKISISKIASTTYTEEEINIFLKNCKDSMLKVGQNFFSI